MGVSVGIVPPSPPLGVKLEVGGFEGNHVVLPPLTRPVGVAVGIMPPLTPRSRPVSVGLPGVGMEL